MYASLFPFTQVSFHMKSLSIYTGLFSYEVSFHLHRSLFIWSLFPFTQVSFHMKSLHLHRSLFIWSLFPFTQVSFHMKSLSIYTGLFSYEVSFHLHRSLFIWSLFPFTQVSFHMKSLSIYTGLFSYEKSPVLEELVKREDARRDDELCKKRARFKWKETYVHRKRPKHITHTGKVCFSRSRLAYITGKQFWEMNASSRSTSSAKTGLFSYEKRPIYMERDLYVWKETCVHEKDPMRVGMSHVIHVSALRHICEWGMSDQTRSSSIQIYIHIYR